MAAGRQIMKLYVQLSKANAPFAKGLTKPINIKDYSPQ